MSKKKSAKKKVAQRAKGRFQDVRRGAANEAKLVRKKVLTGVGGRAHGQALKLPLGVKSAMFAANVHFQEQRYDEALALYREISVLGVSAATHRIGRIYEKQGKYSEALEVFSTLSTEDPCNGEAAYRAAVCAASLGDNSRCEAFLMRAVESGVRDSRYADMLWGRLSKSTPLWRRVEVAEYVLSHDPIDRAVWLRRLADYRWRMNDHVGSAECINELRKSKSLTPSEKYRLGMNAFEREERAAAKRFFDAAVQAGGEDARRIGAAYYAEKEQDWGAAIRLVEAFPGEATPAERIYEMAFCFEKLMDYQEAASLYAAAIVLDGGRAYWHYKLGLTLERLGQFDNAIAAYEVAISLGGENSHWRFRSARCMQKLGRFEDAFYCFAEAFSVDTNALTLGRVAGSTPAKSHMKVMIPTRGRGVDDASIDSREASYQELLKENSRVGFAQHRFTLKGWIERNLASMRLDGDFEASDLGLLSKLALKGNRSVRVEIALMAASRGYWELAATTLEHIEEFGDKDGLNPASYLKAASSRRDVHYAEALRVLPIVQNVVLWESNHGSSFGCHPLAMLRAMLDDPAYAHFTHVIGLNDPSAAPKDIFEHPNVSFVRLHSRSYLQVLATAQYLVSNVSFAPYFVRRSGQEYLNTWHGTPMKTLGRSMRGKLLEYENLQRNFQVSTMLMAPNKLTEWALVEDHDIADSYRGKSVIAGSPRLDTSINMTDEDRKALRAQLGINANESRKVVLFAPTWRGGVSERELDREALVEDLTAMSSAPDTILLYRAHRLTEKLLEGVDLPVTVVPAHIDTNELLAIIDVLVTDYSSILFDFIPQQKPVVLYVHDIDTYREERGLYLEPEEVPGLVAHNRKSLIEAIIEASRGAGIPNAEHMRAFTEFEDGNASLRMVKAFFDGDFDGCQVRDYAVDHGAVGKTSLLFHASLIPNGIASAFLALLHAIDYSKYSVSVIVEPEVLRNNEDRAANFSKLPTQVHKLCRVGGFVDTIREKALTQGFAARPDYASKVFWDAYWERYDKERRRLFGDFVPDAAIEYDGYSELWVSLLAVFGRLGSETSCYQHNQMRNEMELKLPNLRRTFALYNAFDHIIAVSERLADVNERGLAEVGYPTGDRQTFARNLLNSSKVRELALEEPQDDVRAFVTKFDKTFVTIGRMSHEKNQLALIGALKKVVDAGHDVGLVLVGSGLLQNVLEARVEALGIGNRVLFTGQQENPIATLIAGDCFILPSTHEGQPVTLLEAMCMKKDVISSDAPGSKELIDLGYGLLCGTSEDAIAAAIVDYLMDPELARGEFDPDSFSQAALEKTLSVIYG